MCEKVIRSVALDERAMWYCGMSDSVKHAQSSTHSNGEENTKLETHESIYFARSLTVFFSRKQRKIMHRSSPASFT